VYASFEDKNISKEVHTYKMIELKKLQFTPLNDDEFKDYIANNINVNENLSSPQRKIIEDTLYLQVAMVGTIVVIASLPESISKWDSEQASTDSLGAKWRKNVSDGPVMDEDDFLINYLGHPISGAIYYTMARNDGLDRFESFLFSSFMSTFVWEYGYEAFAEVPSIQDLWSTPVIGSLMGEYMYYLEKDLDKQNGLLFNSRWLGNISYFLLNPMGRMADGMSQFFGLDVTMRFQTYQPYNSQAKKNYNRAINTPSQFASFDYGVVVDLKF